MIARISICLIVITLFSLATNFLLGKYQSDLMNNANQFIDLTKKIPDQIGPWKRTDVQPLQDYAVEQLKVRDAEHWTYTNEQTGEKVFISFLVGPTGRLGQHTPEICLRGQGYRELQKRKREKIVVHGPEVNSLLEESIQNEAGQPGEARSDADEFWRVSMGNAAAPGYHLVFYYALGTGKQWWAKENPRFELSNYPFVLKMQVETYTTDDPEIYNPARSFLKAFLPEVEKVFADTDLQGMYGG